MTLRLNLGSYLQRHQITAYRLVQEVEGKVAPNTVYALARKPAQRIDLNTVSEVLHALERLTGEHVPISDVLEEVAEVPKADLSHLSADPGRPIYDPSMAKVFRYSGMGKAVDVRGGPSIVDIIAEGRGRTSS
jgi:hypothetical protein